MAFAPRLYITIFTAISTALSVAIIGIAGHILWLYNTQKNTNPWWLPLWPQHFDDRGLKAMVGGSSAVVVLNIALVAAQYAKAKWQKDAVFATSLLSAVAAGVEIIYPSVLNQQAPLRDTMQSWTCKWSSTTDPVSAGVPSNFGSLCIQNKFAFYAAVPVLVLQLAVLALVMWSAKKTSSQAEALRLKTENSHELPSYEATIRSGRSPSADERR